MVLRTAERITLECDQRHSSLFIAVDTEAERNVRLYLASHHVCDITHRQKLSRHNAKTAPGAGFRLLAVVVARLQMVDSDGIYR